ncbi:hypothetical protein B0A52_03527 [Exophiala mesophila]|uniref:SMP domain-containing protein n=1 Tax=Exophiala mesophila TaxID=212818 RepID=A0A438N6I5_EXOME|nr:hypothetical protein B0A52_03527 [Exophiala mesophila]
MLVCPLSPSSEITDLSSKRQDNQPYPILPTPITNPAPQETCEIVEKSSKMSNPMSKDDASRIQSSQARNGGDMSSSESAARAQAAGDRNSNSNVSNASGGTRSAGGGQHGGSSTRQK